MSVEDEIAKFDRIAPDWWDPRGPMRPLHAMQPVRMAYVLDQLAAAGLLRGGAEPRDRLAGARIADLGCGAGLMTEPLARLGARVVGLDLSEAALAAARAHASAGGLEIDYRLERAETLADGVAAGREPGFDAVLALEVVEHLDARAAFLAAARRCLKPGGVFVASTLNRTPRSYLAAIVGAEYVLGWLPRGTHDWSRFVAPRALAADCAAAGFRVVDRVGFVFSPLTRQWSRSERDLSVNYALAAVCDDPIPGDA